MVSRVRARQIDASDLDGKSRKYFNGPSQPSFGDLAYTEAIMFGL
jgi:hypothetical protein